MIRLAQERGYNFINFNDVKFISENSKDTTYDLISNYNKGQILLRHDVDVNLSAAAKMASAEHKLGVKTTYFLMWRSPCYNLMSRSSQKYVEKILTLGHSIGLHYDHGFDLENKKDSSLLTNKSKYNQSGWKHFFHVKLVLFPFINLILRLFKN